jgi:hypothetical protein
MLQRRVCGEGVTFARVVAPSRVDVAQHMLDDAARKVIDVALDLGYSDPPTSRARSRAGRASRRVNSGSFARPGAWSGSRLLRRGRTLGERRGWGVL